MPKRKVNRTIRGRGKGKRDAVVRSMTSSAMRGATSLSNKSIYKPMKRPRKGNRLDRSKALRSMTSSMASGLSSVGRSAYDMGMPMIEEAGRSVGKSVSKFMSDQKVPKVPPAWVDFKSALTRALVNIGILDHDEEIPPPIYFQSVQKFLDIHKDVNINSGLINIKMKTFEGIHPGNPGDATPRIMKDFFKRGITHDSIISALEYGFQDVLLPPEDYMGIEPEPEPGQGFNAAKERTKNTHKYKKVVELSRGIEILMVDKSGKYDSLIRERLLKLNSMVTNDKEKEALARLLKMYPQLEDMLKAGYKSKKSKRRKRKRTGRKRTGRKRTGSR